MSQNITKIGNECGPPAFETMYSNFTPYNSELDFDLRTAASNADDPVIFENILKSQHHDIDQQNSAGWTPLMYACNSGNRQAVELLLEAGADQTILNGKKRNALIITVLSGNEDIVTILTLPGAMEVHDVLGWNALMHAISNGYYSIVKFLLKNGADPNPLEFSSAPSPLMIAVVESDLEIVQLLLTAGADPTFVSPRNNCTAADVAKEHGHNYLAAYLNNSTCWCMPSYHAEDLETLLRLINLEKYLPFFEEKSINLEEFLEFDENDLKEIGIRLLGPRKKMRGAIDTINFMKAKGLY